MNRSLLSLAALALLGTACGPKAATVSEAQAASERSACKFVAGDLASKSLATDDPTGTKIPINHFVLLMQENRSFDAYFSKLTVPGQTVEAATDSDWNPDAEGNKVYRFHWSATTASNANSTDNADYYCFSDTGHGWDQTHQELHYDGGVDDGFVVANDDPTQSDGEGNGDRAMGYYDQTDLPYYYALAQDFAISDHHFDSVLGPTWPNRFFFYAGTSFGLTWNTFPGNQPNGQPYPSLFSRLDAAKVTWKDYFVDLPAVAILPAVFASDMSHLVPLSQFYVDAASGNLPQVAIVDGSDAGKGTATLPDGSSVIAVDEHPPQDIQLGQAFVASVVNALMASPNWPTAAFFLTYDEHGGEYDHVVPPAACAPDNLPLQLNAQNGATVTAGFNQYGFRTPLLVVSPFVKHGYVSHEVVDHTSIIRLVEARFNLPALTARDANAWPLLDMFDFAHPDTTVPTLPDATIDSSQQAQCQADFPPSTSGL